MPDYPYIPGAIKPPSWWKSQALTPSTDSTSFLRVANALIPYYSNPDQASVGTFLGADASGLFKDYLGIHSQSPNPLVQKDLVSEWYTPDANQNGTYTRQQFLNTDRAAQALASLKQMREAAGLTEDQMGPGFKFLTQAVNLLSRFGVNLAAGEQGVTRSDYQQLQSQLSALTDQAKADKSLAPYAELATKFINPTVLGSLMPTSTSATGQTIYGQASGRLFK